MNPKELIIETCTDIAKILHDVHGFLMTLQSDLSGPDINKYRKEYIGNVNVLLSKLDKLYNTTTNQPEAQPQDYVRIQCVGNSGPYVVIENADRTVVRSVADMNALHETNT